MCGDYLDLFGYILNGKPGYLVCPPSSLAVDLKKRAETGSTALAQYVSLCKWTILRVGKPNDLHYTVRMVYTFVGQYINNLQI